MIAPTMFARVEQANDFAIERVSTSEIGAFMVVARETNKAKVAGYGFASMLLCDDVIDFKFHLIELLRHMSVFTLM